MKEWILLMNEWMKFIGCGGGMVDYHEKIDSDDDLQFLAFNKFMLKIQLKIKFQFIGNAMSIHPRIQDICGNFPESKTVKW